MKRMSRKPEGGKPAMSSAPMEKGKMKMDMQTAAKKPAMNSGGKMHAAPKEPKPKGMGGELSNQTRKKMGDVAGTPVAGAADHPKPPGGSVGGGGGPMMKQPGGPLTGGSGEVVHRVIHVHQHYHHKAAQNPGKPEGEMK
jgi:hypothetical protein